ncbi:RNA polymerase-associated protein RapA [Andreesenia angusta]|uniref:RNA polymerase-associated protein RapA n=1 Tax=Andreesenia angusta TaxID=39480 RepID=A0A1S1VAF1_9FIRM|nr:helicase-related protein [Andreesenia angusta]OHW63400.1 RNA polymerase-associated protein RapA [Andreesenia angusta]
MYNIGETVYDTIKNEKVQILDKLEAWGFISYKVYNPSEDSVYKLSSDQISAEDRDVDNINVDYIKYISLLSKIKNELSSGLLSSLSNGIIPLPHQLHVLNRAVSNNNIRYILADEVGLGKTIEAGLIIKELKARGLIKRVLVVCPKGLVTQWKLEMEEKFDEKFHIILPEDFGTIKKISESDDVYGQFDQVISPMDSIKPLEKRAGWTEEKIAEYNEDRIYSIINSGWDLVIIDEAHRVAGSSGEVARYKLGNLLASSSPYLLLLTATPHNGKTEPFLRLIRLIDEKAFPNFKAIVKEQVAPYIIRTEKRDAIDNNGNKLFKDRVTQVVEVTWDDRHTMQRELYELTSKYVSKGYNRAMRARGKNMWVIFLLIMMQRLVTSSTSAIRKSLEKRIEVLKEQNFRINNLTQEEFAEMELEENMEEALSAISFDMEDELKELSAIVNVAKQAEFQYLDAKIEPFIDIVESLFAEDRNRKIIVFTEFVATQDYLSTLLIKRGYTTSLLNGSMSIEERNILLEEFKTKTNILISTDAGGEGLNLQFSNVVINFDLPWNPMKIEQRIGRVDRIGQQRDVHIYNFILAETVEKRVKDVLEEKLSLILKEIGVDKYSDVLDSEFSEMSFTDAYMNSVRNPKEVEHYISPIEEDLRVQVKNANKFREIMHEEKNLADFIGAETSFDVESALKHMVTYYENYKGNPYFPLESLSINDSQIIKHLNKEIEFSAKDGVMAIEIKDFPNESGYFGLWEISLSEDIHSKKIIPIFINDKFILRPMAGKKILDEIVKKSSLLNYRSMIDLEEAEYDRIKDMTKEFVYDTFLDMKSEFEKKNEENYRKYLYAIELRIEAAKNIGIENIKQHKLKNLFREREMVEAEYKMGKAVCPEFRPILMVYLEE